MGRRYMNSQAFFFFLNDGQQWPSACFGNIRVLFLLRVNVLDKEHCVGMKNTHTLLSTR